MEGAVKSAAEALPSEVLERIFSYCTQKDLVQSIQNVCSRWREVAQSTRLWKRVTYCPSENTSSEQIVKMLKISPKLQNLILKIEHGDAVLHAITENCAELKKLQISELPDLDLNFLKNLQEKCPKVEHLSIPDTVLTDLDKCEVVAKFVNLKVLILTRFREKRGSVYLKPLADHCKELEHLEFQHMKFEMNDLRHFLCMRKGTLHTLGLRCCSESGECVLPVVSTCMLETLSLFSFSVCCRHAEKIKYFRRLKTVRALTIEDLQFTKPDLIKKIFENENMAQLRKLSLYRAYSFNDEVTDVIVTNCPLLQSLTLDLCEMMTDASLKMVTNFKQLSSLTLSTNNKITDAGIFHLQDVKGLNYLRIECCERVTKLGMNSIVNLSTLRDLKLRRQDLSEFQWDLIPHNMKYLRCLDINSCGEDIVAIKKMKRQLPGLRVSLDGNTSSEYCTVDDSLNLSYEFFP
ncbi:F-box/LRR-repeat protein 2 [Anabrus simplex]|uniref:F-box/LRR-repeat protein 2 n=1 Tax=Anabrus simplex TaxID=316456 RepID=UPI0035A38E02